MTTNDTSTTAAVAEHEAGHFDQAESIYRAVLLESPNDLAALIGLGDVLTDAGQQMQALEFYRRAIAIDPEAPANAGAYDGLAAILQDMGDLDNAIPASKKAAVLRGSAEDALGVGHSLEYLGKISDAIDMFQLAAELKPDYYEAHAKAAMYLLSTGKAAASIPHYLSAIREKPEVAELHCNLANARRLSGEMNLALDSVRTAIQLKPELAEAHTVMGALWKDRRRWSDALASLTRAVQLKPDAADAINNAGTVLEAIGRLPEATPYFERAVMLRSDILEFHANLANNLLTRGEFARGWDEWEWRRADPHQTAGRTFDKPAWDGSSLAGKTILVHAEASVARAILFLRYLPIFKNLGATLIFECPAVLEPLARQMGDIAQVITQGNPLPAFDLHCPLLSLGKAFNTKLADIPPVVPLHGHHSKKLAVAKTGRRIGVVFPESHNAATDRAATDRDRHCPLDKFAALSKLQDVELVAMQPAVGPLPDGLNVVDLSGDIANLEAAAAIIEDLDLVVGADSVLTHLAATMGKPTFIVLPTVAGWEWLLDREDSPWYPTVRLFRHSTTRSWSATFDALVEACKSSLLPNA